MRIKWFPNAIKDLNGIYEYYATKSVRTAVIMYNGILDDTELLKNQPCKAAIEPILNDFPKTYRSLVVAKGKFKVIYYMKMT